MTNDTYSIQTPELPARTNPENVNAPPLPERNRILTDAHILKKSQYFQDGERSVDYVLAWMADDEYTVHNDIKFERRKIFEKNLIKEGLQLEHNENENYDKYGLNFTKIHADKEVCKRYSEVLRLRMPMKPIEECCRMQPSNSASSKVLGFFNTPWNMFMNTFFYPNEVLFPKTSQEFTAVYSRDKEYLFDVASPNFFTATVRSRIVQFILERTLFATEECNDICNFGIEHLINDDVYRAAYPLHDGLIHVPGSQRYTLYHEWASVKKFYRCQPVDYIKEYFGVKIALYFTWLGFYTYMLIPASIVGLLCFVYSLCTVYDNLPSEQICNESVNATMCPLCDVNCGYWNITETCIHARITYLFDNNTTVLFAIFMCFWATLFLECWKRYSAGITHRWDVTGFDKQEEYPRPEYLARLKNTSTRTINAVTNVAEPKVPFWTLRLPITLLSFSIVVFLISIVFAAVIGVVLYRISILAAFYTYGDDMITSYALILTNVTAATINLCCIVVLNVVYTKLARYLTELELLRTQTEFDDSLTLKMYLFQFVNYYASIIYIAFFKGKFVGYPKSYNRIFGYRQEECGPGGCLLELCIQLSIIMVGKQTVNTIVEIIEPWIYKWWKTFSMKDNNNEMAPQWMEDYRLIEWGPQALFPEYLEMVLQYGFITIFVSAFPLAPLFALLNNILEMRLDAKKLLTYYRRPVTQRVKNIGIWYRILDSIGKLAVVTNSFIIAFTSDFIPKWVYRITESKNFTLDGYTDYSMSYINITDLDLRSDYVPRNPNNITNCRYIGFRRPPWSNLGVYDLTQQYWYVTVARLLFIVVFQNFVAMVIILIKWFIPDVPSKLKYQIQRERYITNEIVISHERNRIQTMTISPQII